MNVKQSRTVSLALASLLVVSIALVGLAYAPTVEADHGNCIPPKQKTTYGCCSCNVLKAIYWQCNQSHNWEVSGSVCLWGQCCAFPCCS